jgi:hypothetical protein
VCVCVCGGLERVCGLGWVPGGVCVVWVGTCWSWCLVVVVDIGNAGVWVAHWVVVRGVEGICGM